ncbi:MAG: OmpA family protein [Rhodothermaceae bacterium]|nr:OmpA family protein [Rhodothermaceae bacterium]
MKSIMLQSKWLQPLIRYTIVLFLIVMIGCGGPPANNPLLNDAREKYEAAHNDESIVRLAPVELKEAEEALEMSTKLWEEKADKTEVDHYAYIAERKTLIARETALLKAAQEEISRGETERQQVMLDVRRADAQRSEQRATSALEDAQRERLAATEARAGAESARLSAEESRLRAEELAKKVSELEARPTDRGLVLTLGDVLFDFGQATLKSGGMQTVNQLGDFLNEYPERHILIEGFTDNIGSEAFNAALSTRRAENVKSALMSKGVGSERIRVRGYGIQYPVANNATEEGRRQNRRVEVVISDQDGVIKERTGSN